MEDSFSIVIKALVCALPGAWLALGVLDNLRYPDINRSEVARVLRLEALDEWPEVRARVGHRRIENATVIRAAFVLIVLAELSASCLLLAGAIGLAGHGFGTWSLAPALTVAQGGALAFTCVWAGMLIGGQWFYYWYGEFGQQTHFLAALWGLGTLVILMI